MHDPDVLVTYREFVPSPALRRHVRAFYSFVPGAPLWRGRRAVTREVRFTREESFCSPMFAAGQASLVVDLGATCALGSGWIFGTRVKARVIGALRTVGAPAKGEQSEMIGAYFTAGSTSALLHVPAVELTDQVIDLEDLWGSRGARLAADLAALDEAARVDRLEAVLSAQLHRARAMQSRLDIAGLASWVQAEPTQMSVSRLADAAGVSRQHLARVFRATIGMSPKRYCRLARFQAGLVYAGAGSGVRWAEAAVELGYTDQSHMIAEFRELSSLTPESLAAKRWFHPFIMDARSRIPRLVE